MDRLNSQPGPLEAPARTLERNGGDRSDPGAEENERNGSGSWKIQAVKRLRLAPSLLTSTRVRDRILAEVGDKSRACAQLEELLERVEEESAHEREVAS